MPTMKPTILSPVSRFAISHQKSHPRSPSRSPSRQQFPMSHELDPLLANLSPTSTLEALEATDAIDPEGKAGQSILHDSVAAASTSERALGIRAALAGKKLKEWHAELAAWPWPNASSSSYNAFRVPPKEERSSERFERNHEGYINKAISEQRSAYDFENPEAEEYWGGLPAKVVQGYEDRIEEIMEDMEALGVEELKDYVRDAHLISNPRRVSRTLQDKGLSGTQYIHLDDFTAVITATIMQALPIISRLNSLIATWSMRLVILRQIPVFLELLEYSQFSIAAAWNAIGNMDGIIVTDGLGATSTALSSKRVTMENNIRELGRRVDSMLDLLEGREDTIPEEWIDSMESIEAEFGNWVVETERRLMEEEWKIDRGIRESEMPLHEEEAEPILQGQDKYSGDNANRDIPEGSQTADGYHSENRAGRIHHHHEELSNPDTEDNIPEKDYESDSEDKTKRIYQDHESLPNAENLNKTLEWNHKSDSHTSVEDDPGKAPNGDTDDKIPTGEPIDNHVVKDKAEQTYYDYRNPPDGHTESKKSEWGSEPDGIYQSQSIPLTLAAPFESTRQTHRKEEHEPAITEFDMKLLNINTETEIDDSRVSKFQEDSRLPGGPIIGVLEATSDLSANKDSSHEIRNDGPAHEKAHSSEVDDVAVSCLDPANNSSTSVAVSVRGDVSNGSRIVTTDQGRLLFHTEPISIVSIPPTNQSSAIQDDLAPSESNESTDLVETASVSSRISEQVSTPADNPSVDISETHVPKKSKGKKSKAPKPAPLLLRKLHSNSESNGPSEVSSDSSSPGSGTSEYFSNMSSPEIQHASMAEYFENPVEVSTPLKGPSTPLGNFPRRSSMLPDRVDNGMYETGSIPTFTLSLNNRRRASSFAPDPSIPESAGYMDELPVHRETVRSHIRVRSASLKSFEVIPRHEIRNVTIRRSESYSSTVPGHSSSHSEDKSANNALPSDLPSSEKVVQGQVAPIHQDSDDQSRPEMAAEGESDLDKSGRATPIAISSSVNTKSRHRFENVLDLSPGLTPAKLRRRKGARPAATDLSAEKGLTPPPVPTAIKNSEDQLEARISSILTEIPGHIRFKSGPEPDAPDVVPSGVLIDQKKYNSRSPALRLKRPPTSAPSSPLTLTPAHSKRPRSSSGDPEIKLYHLHQSGKDVPIKLLVRLVGEGGERVMVRIGGGWADLGEYLKEYASHHGRRSTSDGRFEIQGLPQPQSGTPLSTVAMSSPPASPTSRPVTPSMRASSSLSLRRPHHSAGSSLEFDAPPMTPENPPLRYFEPTPGSMQTTSSLRPSSRSSRFSSTDDDSPLGLAGPKTRRKDVSPSKQAWVDGMLDQARKASAEKKKGGEGDFGDLGKVGSTKRVFMRSR